MESAACLPRSGFVQQSNPADTLRAPLISSVFAFKEKTIMLYKSNKVLHIAILYGIVV